MNINELMGGVFAILFASGEEISIERLCEACEVDKPTMKRLLALLQDKLHQADLGIELLELSGNYQLSTKAQYAPYIKKALEIKRNMPLSGAAFEVLAIIAYNQPVTKSFVEQIRGVDSSGVVNSLLEKGLIEEAGRLELPGHPISYQTAPGFLRCFGLSSLQDLPAPPRIEDQSEDAERSES